MTRAQGVGAMKELVGRRILSMYMANGEHELLFSTNLGTLLYVTEGDCCSETWFADIIGADNLLNAVVYIVQDIDLPNPDDTRSRQDVDQAYGIRIITSRGTGEIIYRNSSNGYYGGWCKHVPLSAEDTGVMIGREITADWSA